jgi:type II pantothenate kinase
MKTVLRNERNPSKFRTYHSLGGSGTAVGVDVGATLAKLAIREGSRVRYALLDSESLDLVAGEIFEARPEHVGLTGGGAQALSGLLDAEPVRVNEFAAWGAGMSTILESAGEPGRYVMASVGTGTSVLLADGLSVTRIGGTALGGGTILGLGALLLSTHSFDEITALAQTGERRHVDLRVSDIYRSGEFPLASELTAASFGKLARGDTAPTREDLADALMGLVGENVALICGSLAAAAQVARVVFAGSTLRDNAALRNVLEQVTSAMGRAPVFPPDGEFAGALGALELAS